MSQGIIGLHSHSILERDLKYPKHIVLVDSKFSKLFKEKKRVTIKKIPYFQVSIQDFVKKGGVFKALAE